MFLTGLDRGDTKIEAGSKAFRMSLLEVGRVEKMTAAFASGVITESGFGLFYGNNPRGML